ncbi:hypothetical protein ACC809_36725, partial [Rhizobium johnstonii]
SGSSVAARDDKPSGVTYFPYSFRGPDHLIAYTKSDFFKRLAKGYEDKTGNLFAAYQGRIFRIDRHPVMSRHPVTPMDEADLAVHL